MENHGYQTEESNKPPFAITRYPSTRNDDYLVEVNARAKMFKKHNFFKSLAVLLGVTAFILLVLCIIFGVLYHQKIFTMKMCTSEECLRSAANLRLSLDLSVDPCEDFYQYTCGRWSAEHPNHGWFPSFSTFSTISEHVLIATEYFLTDKNKDQDPKPVRQARDFYKSCMDQESINHLGLSLVYKYLKEVKLPPIPSLFTKTDDEIEKFKFDWLKADVNIKKLFHMDIFIGFGIDANSYNRTENVMYIGTPGNSCPLPTPLKKTNKKFSRKKRNSAEELLNLAKTAKSNIVTYIVGLMVLNSTGTSADQDKLNHGVEVIINMTNYMDELISNYTNYGSYGVPITAQKLQAKTDSYLEGVINTTAPNIYEKYIKTLFASTNISIDLSKDLLYLSEEEEPYLPKVLAYILTTSDIYLELYMWWMTVYAMIINTTDEVIYYIARQTEPFYIGNSVIRSQSLDCCALVNSFMGMAVSYGIADRELGNKTKPQVERMLYEIKNAFIEHVKGLSWMDAETRNATLEKSKEMISFIGYPDWLFSDGALEIYYEGIEIKNDSYLENMMSVTRMYFPSHLNDLRITNERNWSTDPTTVNAFNSFPDNAINVPMGILAFPVYNLGLEVLNYGAIGTVLGHELTHGFDNTGRKHDKFGNYKQWWTNETIETFEEKIECFIDQYDNFTITGIEQTVQGLQTLGENLADNGGLNHAYRAFLNHKRKSIREPKLPGFENYTHNQLFFLAFASIWCETITYDDLVDQITYDEHCPNSVRVLGTLQNSADFAKAFHCPVGSRMNPEGDKCKVW